MGSPAGGPAVALAKAAVVWLAGVFSMSLHVASKLHVPSFKATANAGYHYNGVPL
jgi:hypothetical protein